MRTQEDLMPQHGAPLNHKCKGLPGQTLLLLCAKQTQSITTNYKEWRSRAVKAKVTGTSQTAGKAHHGRDVA